MTDIVERLRATLLDRDNFPRMDSEKWLPVGLAKEAAAEIERLRNLHKTAFDLDMDAKDREIDKLRAAIQRIDGINDNPAIYNPDIEAVVRTIIDPS
jgi:hypothetical protein